MEHLIFELADSENYFDETSVDQAQGFPELAPMQNAWLAKCYQPYQATRDRRASAEMVQIQYELVPTDGLTTIEYQFDTTFLNQLIESYALHGWGLIKALEAKIEANSTPITRDERTLFRQSCLLLLQEIAACLAKHETLLSGYAQKKWNISISQLTKYFDEFKWLGGTKYILKNREQADAFFNLLGDYDAHKREIEKSEAQRQDALRGKYKPDSPVYEALNSSFGEKELEHQTQMTEIAGKIFKLLPAALLILDDYADLLRRPDTKTFRGNKLALTYNQSDIETRIFNKIKEVRAGLVQLKESLGNDNQTASPAKLLADSANGLEGAIAKAALNTWKVSAAIEKVFIASAAVPLAPVALVSVPLGALNSSLVKEKNPVMGLPGLVQEYWATLVSRAPASWERCVFQQYLHALESEIAQQEKDNKKFKLVLTVIKLVEAAVSVLAFMAMVVASEGALLPVTVPIICNLIRTVSHALGLVVLGIIVLEVKIGDEQNTQEWTESLALLRAQEPDTMAVVGTALSKLQVYRYQIGFEIVKLLIKMKATNRIELIAKAVDLENLAADLDTIIIDSNAIIIEGR